MVVLIPPKFSWSSVRHSHTDGQRHWRNGSKLVGLDGLSPRTSLTVRKSDSVGLSCRGGFEASFWADIRQVLERFGFALERWKACRRVLFSMCGVVAMRLIQEEDS